MKRLAPVVILFLFAMIAWNVFSRSHGVDVDFGDGNFDGPFGAVIGLIAAGGGLLIGGVVLLFVGALLTVVFAGVGVVLAMVAALVAVVIAAALAPLLLPVLIPVALIWWFVSRSSRRKEKVLVG